MNPYRLYDSTTGKLVPTKEDFEDFESYQNQIENNMGDGNALLDIAEFILQSYMHCFQISKPETTNNLESQRLDNFFDTTIGPYGVDP